MLGVPGGGPLADGFGRAFPLAVLLRPNVLRPRPLGNPLLRGFIKLLLSFSEKSCSLRKNRSPIILHAHDGPASLFGFVPCLVEFADVGLAIVSPFALSVRVMNNQTEACSVPGRGPLQHLMIAIGVAERGDGSSSNVALDANRLAFLVVD